MNTKSRGHSVQYFLNLTDQYNNNQERRKYWRGDLANGFVRLHRIGDDDTIYIIYKGEDIRVENIRTGEMLYNQITLDQLDGDDFEFANSILIYKSGYVSVKDLETAKGNTRVKEIISELHKHIEWLNEDPFVDKSETPSICGGSAWWNGLTDEFEYYAANGIEVHVQTIAKFYKYNSGRKFFEMKSIPFDKNMCNNSAFHVTMIDFAKNGTDKEQIKRCDQALEELLSYLKEEINVGFEWVDTPLNKPLFY